MSKPYLRPISTVLSRGTATQKSKTIMKQLKILGIPVASFGEVPQKPGGGTGPTTNSNDINNVAQVGSLPDPGPVPSRQTKFLSPRYEPGNISQNADVQRVQTAIRQAENGDTQEYFRFLRDVLLGDDHIQSCFNTRKLALLAQPLCVLPKDKNNPDDIGLALAMTQAIDDCENWTDGLLALMDSNGFWPNSIVERLYKPAGDSPMSPVQSPKPSEAPPANPEQKAKPAKPAMPKLQYTLRKFVAVNPQLHCYQWAYMMGGVGLGTASAIQLSQMAGTPGEGTGPTVDGSADPANPYRIDLERWEPYLKLWPIDVAGRIVYDVTRASYLDPKRHIVHRGHLMQTFRDNWGGPARAILMWWLLRQLGREWFARGMERYGNPWPVGYTDATDPVAVDLLREAFDLAKKIGGLVVDESSRVELKEAMVQGMAQGYETFARMCNEAISYHITGLKESQKPAGLNAGQSNFTSNVREDVRMFDQMKLGETCVKQIAIPFRDINGLKGNVKFVWGGLSDTDAKTFADFLVSMKNAGFQASDDSLPTINERTGMTWEKAQAPDMTPNPKGGKPGEDDDEPRTYAAKLKWLSASTAESPVEDVVRGHQAALERAFRGALAPVRQIILNSTSQRDAETKLKALFADWPAERIALIVEEAMQICAARGLAQDN